MNDYESEYSRSATRGRKRKQNRLLNLLIIIVVVLILIVGYSILFAGGHSNQASGPNTHNSANGPNNGGDQGSAGTAAQSNDGKKKSQSDQSGKSTDDSSSTKDQTQDSKQKETNDSTDSEKTTTGPHNLVVPQGPWDPVGTEQQPPHHTSYDSQSQDWAEQLKAIYEATGLTSDNSTLWWLERDGAPDQSVGYVSPKSDKSAFYIVHIKWVDQKGWKPVKVERQYVEDPHAWFEQKKSE
ncbi:MAG TPA: YrrS family protein [Bacillales bacterium]|nr:YrrS family protein [Bacillales bacterium]